MINRRCAVLLLLCWLPSWGSSTELAVQLGIPNLIPVQPPGVNLPNGVQLLALSAATSFDVYRCRPADTALLESAANVAAAALAVYPAALLRRSGLRYLIFCASLSDRANQRPGGVPNPALGALLFDLTYLPVAAFAGAMHHEFYHLLDHAIDEDYQDPAWEALNPMGFQYFGSDRRRRNFDARFASGRRGFITGYAQASIAEDKAELFRWLLTDHRRVLLQARDDPSLRAKVGYLKAELQRIAAAVSNDFWQHLERRQR